MKKIGLIFLLLLSISSFAKSQEIKALTYNIRYDNPDDGVNKWNERKSSMIELLNRYKPDIFGIQEGLVNQVAFLAENMKDFKYIGVGRDDGKSLGEFSAIYYNSKKFKVIESSTFWLSERFDTISVGWDASMNRICSYGVFECVGTKKKFFVFNTHFDHIGVIAREKSAELIVRRIKALNKKGYPVIVMGDLNSEPDNKAIEVLRKNLDDGLLTNKGIPPASEATFNGFDKNSKEYKRIDYIFVKKFKVLNYKHISDMRADGNFISDHFPVLATLKF